MPRAWRWVALACLPVLAAGLVMAWQLPAMPAGGPLAPPVLPRENKALEGRLAFARKLAADQKWAEAIETYAGILHDVGDKLVPVETPLDAVSSAGRSLQIRLQCHLDIAAFPKKALQQYRATVKAQAKQWLEAGLANRDEEPLLKIVREAFCSSAGDQALDTLGDLAFEKGDFHQAYEWWRLLAVPPAEDPNLPTGRLVFPDPQLDPARVRTKMILALLFDGNEFQARAEFVAFEKLHPDAAGHLAGVQGNYAKTLKQWLARGSPALDRDLFWPTLAGNAARNGALPQLPHHRLWADGPTWTVALAGKPAGDGAPHKTLAERARELSYFPIILENRVLVSDGRSVSLLDLLTGQKLDGYALSPKQFQPAKKAADRALTRHTLTAAGNKVFAVLGDPHLAPARNGERGKTTSYLVCLELAGKEASGLKLLWQVRAREQDDDAALFEGTPVVLEDRVYALCSRARGLQLTSCVACFHAETGQQLWQEELARYTEAEDDNPPAVVDQPLLTLAGNRLICSAQRGVIQAVDPWTGTQAWAVKYPGRGPITIEGTPSPHKLCPCLYAEGRVYAAPLDSDRILCLDAATGQVQWERDRVQAVHLLGCHFGKLIFTTPDGLRALDARTGSDKGGWLQPAVGRLPPYGRGLVLGEWVLWPTQHPEFPLHLVHQATGLPHGKGLTFSPVQLRQIKPGNMAFANGCLVVAGTTELSAYVAPKLLLKQNEKDAGVPKPAPMSLYKLARSEADAGLVDQALQHFRQAEKATIPEDWEKELFQWKCLTARHDLLMTAARDEREITKAAKWLQLAAQTDFSPEMRLVALDELAARLFASGQNQQALLSCQAILDEESLRNASNLYCREKNSFTDWWDRHWPIRGKDLAEYRIASYLRDHGRKDYQPIEEKAQRLAAKAKAADLVPVLEQLLEQYPNSLEADGAKERLFHWYEQHGQIGSSAQMAHARHYHADGTLNWKVPLQIWIDHIQAYEKQQCWEAAKEEWEYLDENFGHNWFPGQEKKQKLSDLVKARLRHPSYADVANAQLVKECVPDMPLPLVDQWQAKTGGIVVPHFHKSSPRLLQLFYTTQGKEISCSQVASAQRKWSTSLPFAPNWVGTVGDIVIAAGPKGITGLRLHDGRPLWTWVVPGVAKPTGASVLLSDPWPPIAPSTLSNFVLTADALCFYQDDRRMLRLMPDHGHIRQSIRPQLAWGPVFSAQEIINDQVALCPLNASATFAQYSCPAAYLDFPELCLVKDADTIAMVQRWGDLPAEFPKISIPPWCPIDAKHSKWIYKPRLPTTLTGELPRLFARKKCLLALLPRNYGYDLERIDPKTGTNIWKPAARLCDHAYERDALAFHQNAVYYASGNTLFARNLDNGNLLWKRDLPESVRGWRVKATKQALLVFPGAMDEPRMQTIPLGSLSLTVPTRKKPKYPFCLQVHAFKDGQLVQRLQFEGDVTGAGIQFFPDAVVVTAGGKAWGLRGQKK